MASSESDLTIANEPSVLLEPDARAMIENFLTQTLGLCPEVYLFEARHFENFQWGWAFWILPEDSSSYVLSDLRIQWNGTAWEPHGGPEP